MKLGQPEVHDNWILWQVKTYKCYFYSHEPGTLLKSMGKPHITDLYVTNPNRYITEIVPEMNKKNVNTLTR